MTLKERAYHHIRSGLLDGRWTAGRMLSPNQLAKMIGMSLTPVREAVLQLENEGLVEVIAKVGVRPRELDRSALEQMFEFRTILETSAGRLAAERITTDAATALQENCQLQLAVLHHIRRTLSRRVEDVLRDGEWIGPIRDQGMKVNWEFHELIFQASGNPWLIKSLGDMHLLTRLLKRNIVLPGMNYLAQLARDYAFHRRICRAIVTHRPDTAATLIALHLRNACAYHLSVFDYLREKNDHDLQTTRSDRSVASPAGPHAL